MSKTLFLSPPSFDGFDGGAGARYQARREVTSFWYPTWLAQPAALTPNSRLLDCPPQDIGVEECLRIAKDFERGDIVKARGSASRFDDRLQMKIDQLRVAMPNEVDKSDLLPSTTYDVAALWRQLLGFVDSLANPDLKLLLSTLLADPALMDRLAKALVAHLGDQVLREIAWEVMPDLSGRLQR